ncbi:hypothetical protein ACQY0O_004968 [Thecaphora frezii]
MGSHQQARIILNDQIDAVENAYKPLQALLDSEHMQPQFERSDAHLGGSYAPGVPNPGQFHAYVTDASTPVAQADLNEYGRNFPSMSDFPQSHAMGQDNPRGGQQ